MTSFCEIRLRTINGERAPVCTTCGLVIGAMAPSTDCPRRREPYGSTALQIAAGLKPRVAAPCGPHAAD